MRLPKRAAAIGKALQTCWIFSQNRPNGYLSSFSDGPRVFPTLVRALTDPEPLVRVYAALRMSPRPADKETAVTALVRALGDSAATVRVGACHAGKLGNQPASRRRWRAVRAGQQVFRARAKLNSDDSEQPRSG